jgi:hypothetical protein
MLSIEEANSPLSISEGISLINSVGALAPLREGSGIILIVGVLATLVATLGREVMRSENKQKA